jgi:Methyltransferase domain
MASPDDKTANCQGEEEEEASCCFQGRDPNRTRHGATNQHKMKDFVRWIIRMFDLQPRDVILDVAGGKGELAARLIMCHNMVVTLVDPRRTNIASVYEKTVVPRLPRKWQDRIAEKLKANSSFVEETVNASFRKFDLYFTNESVRTEESLTQAIIQCDLLVGMHADSATECIIDVALQYQKPFVVVPCCVFPNLFQQRFLWNDDGHKIQVRSYEQFCVYLLQKDARFLRSILPFDGRNIAIWWDGKR